METKKATHAPRSVDRLPALAHPLPRFILMVLFFVLPLAFLPAALLPADLFKQALILTALIATLIFFCAESFRGGNFVLPRSPLLVALFLLALTALITSFFAPVPLQALLGSGTDADTALWFVSAALLVLVLANLGTERAALTRIHLAFLAGTALALLWSFKHIALVPLLGRFAWFNALPLSFIGKWYELGIAAGLVSIGLLCVLEFVPILSGRLRLLARLVLLATLLVAAFVNYYPVWVLTTIALLLVLPFVLRARRSAKRGAPYTFLAVFLVSLVMSGALLFNNPISTALRALHARWGVPAAPLIEPAPSLSETLTVMRSVLRRDPLLGAGPNHFSDAWARFKPASANASPGWGSDFSLGRGTLATVPVTQGVLGTLALLALSLALIYECVRLLVRSWHDVTLVPWAAPTCAAALYLSYFLYCYTPSAVLSTAALLAWGSLIALNSARAQQVVISRNQHLALALAVGLVLSAALAYGTATRVLAAHFFVRGVNLANTEGDVTSSRLLIERAQMLHSFDVHQQTQVSIALVELSRITGDTSLSREQLQARFVETFQRALNYASSSVTLHPDGYRNHITLGSVYEAAIPYRISGAREFAERAYRDAGERAPRSPLPPFLRARVAAGSGDTTAARTALAQALTIKTDHVESLLLASQLDAAEGKDRSAAEFAVRAANANPLNVPALFQAGYLTYRIEDDQNAVAIFEHLLRLVPDYANAKYFLGVLMDRQGNRKRALELFADIQKSNPNNQEIREIISNIRAGLPALYGMLRSEATPSLSNGTSSAETADNEE